MVRFVLNDVADSSEPGMRGEHHQLFAHLRAAQVNPADHPLDKRKSISQFEQPARFFDRLPRLNSYGAVNPNQREPRHEVTGQMVFTQDLHARADPAVFTLVVSPEVLMGVDSHCMMAIFMLSPWALKDQRYLEPQHTRSRDTFRYFFVILKSPLRSS